MRSFPGLFVLIVFLSAALIPLDSLKLHDMHSNKLILCRPLTAGDRFSLSYIHSSELSAVTDYFRVDEERQIILYQTRFCSLNTGLPSGAEKNETLRREGDCFRLDNRNIKMHSFDFWAEQKYSNTLALADKLYNVPALVGNSSERSLVRLSVGRTSLGRLLWCNLLP